MSSLNLLLGLLVLVAVSSGAPSARDQIRITGGTPSAQGKWPFFAGLFYKGGFLPYCGGVVWDKDTVLTAAHCLLAPPSAEPENFEIYLGHNEFIIQKNQAYIFKAKEIITHPDYHHRRTLSNDIALIRLDRSIDFDGYNNMVECVCDPEPFHLLDTSKCVVMGWGQDSDNRQPATLFEVVLPILDDVTCDKLNPDFQLASHMCAASPGAGTCAGDSGSPLVCPHKADPSKYSLVGLTAFAMRPCGKNPSYFTRVEYFLEWIGKQSAPH